ncbi:MAG TPA: peptidylprolyl isomerase [Planctomycetota bacterium]|jgi:cyclophilin family peptidyl-prolyl cis-trans isomerase|nr:peptidylprolyl isomerase [Planctomycetota bacterium]
MVLAAVLLAALPGPGLPAPLLPLAPLLLQEEERPQDGGQQDARSEKEKEQQKMDDAARRARMGKEALIKEAEEARLKGILPETLRLTPVANVIASPRLVLAGSPAYLTVTRFDPAPQPGAPSTGAGQPILPQHVVLTMPNGEEKRLDLAVASRPIPPGVELPGVLPPNAVRKTFDIGKALEGAGGGTVSSRYETPGGQPGFGNQIRLLTPLKGGDLEKVDPKTVYLWIETDLGSMVAEFLPDKAPNTARHFLRLAGQGFYDGLSFHRIVRQFMVQGGDPSTGGKTYKGEPLKAEFNDVPHRKGILAMARGSDPDSATTQFFIVHKDHLPHLDRDYKGDRAFPTTAFGRLVEGFDTLDRIASVAVTAKPSGEVSVPEKPPVIQRIVLAEKFAPPAAPAAGVKAPPVPGAKASPAPAAATRPARGRP